MAKNDKPAGGGRKAASKSPAARKNKGHEPKKNAPSTALPVDGPVAAVDDPVEAVEAVEPEARTTPRPASDFPIVGIGASAGGLAAFEQFFSALPKEDTGMAFVLVQHLAPDHKSILHEIVGRYTRMEVHEVEDGVKVK